MWLLRESQDLTPDPVLPLLSRCAAKVPKLCSLEGMNVPRQLTDAGTPQTQQTVWFSSPHPGQPYYWGKEDRMARPSAMDSGGPFLVFPAEERDRGHLVQDTSAGGTSSFLSWGWDGYTGIP